MFVGLLVDVEVNLIPAGHSTLLLVAGVYMHNGASGGFVTVIVDVVVLVELALVTCIQTVYVPACVYVNTGFSSVDVFVVPIPCVKFHIHAVGAVYEAFVNCTAKS